jgi:hypothetical protein
MGVRNYEVEIKGITALIMHWDNIEWADRMELWQRDPENKKNSKAGDDRTPAFRWLGCVYNDGEFVAMPYENIGRCLMEGGAQVPTGRGQKTFKAQTQSGMRMNDPFAPLTVRGGRIRMADVLAMEDVPDFKDHLQLARELGFTLMVKRAQVGRAKHIRVRPRFDDWVLKFGLSVWDDAITPEVLAQILHYSGRYKGLGDWRPGGKTPGPWGTFETVSVKQV